MCDIDGLFDPYPQIELRHDDDEAYTRLRARQPDLSSYMDGRIPEAGLESGVVGIWLKGEPIAVGSYVVDTNAMRAGRSDRYARVDLIIVNPGHRGMGAGRLVILCVLLHLLKTYGPLLYSISSLAAHAAVVRVLEEYGFAGEYRDKQAFKHEARNLEPEEVAPLTAALTVGAEKSLRVLNFRVRQAQGAP